VVSVALLMIRLIRRELPLGRTALVLAIYIVATGTFVVVMWPYLWSRPLGHFVQAFKDMAHFRWGGELRYMGSFIHSTALPWHYTFTWIGITTPLFYLVLFVVGVFVTCRQIVTRGMKLWQDDAELQDIVFLVLCFGPIAAVILFHSVLYNGWRQLYFIYPAFLLLATKGWVAVWSIERSWTRYKISLLVLTTISLVYTAMWMWKAHPLENLYFNVLAGKNVRARYEMDYWGLSNRKALEYILEHDNSPVISVWADSVTPLAKSVFMLKPEDRRRISIEENKGIAYYVLTNYYGVKETDNAKFGREYELFYELKAGDEVVLSVFKWKGATSAEESPDWSGSLTTAKGPGNFAPPPPMRLVYRFGWVGLQAAKAEIQLFSDPDHVRDRRDRRDLRIGADAVQTGHLSTGHRKQNNSQANPFFSGGEISVRNSQNECRLRIESAHRAPGKNPKQLSRHAEDFQVQPGIRHGWRATLGK